MTQTKYLNMSNKKMMGGGNVKQGSNPLATAHFGFYPHLKRNNFTTYNVFLFNDFNKRVMP